ncbi:MAG: GNAT family N-acetyltransferase [Ruminococcus sp.]|nr:GNAT family N-acetyltransferase [Ruminococcus sp.]
MKITLKKADSESLPRLEALYLSAFPENERAPFGRLVKMSRKPWVNFFEARADGEPAGLLYVVNYRDLSYVFYFAVREDLRGRGIGSAILAAARRKYSGRRLFLAIEQLDESAENYAQRLSRRSFYIKNGFEPLGSKAREGPVVFDLLGIGGPVGNREYRALMRSALGPLMMLVLPIGIIGS